MITRLRQAIRSSIKISFCQKKNDDSGFEGTQYNLWVLARSANHNHNIEHLKRKSVKDRYNIHKLTNLRFMCELATMDYKYKLTINEKILLLAQMNHIIQVTGKDRKVYFQLNQLISKISQDLQDPHDLPCLGTMMHALVSMEAFQQQYWQYLIDDVLAEKFDQNYDELFGVFIGLAHYRRNLLASNDYLTISKDNVTPNIPIIYRNSLEVLRQYITFNIFNLKECKILFEALHLANINQGFFWKSVRDWFNIFVKQQIKKKQIDQFFIMKQSAVQKVLFDHGMIRPRPILQQLSSIVFVLSENGFISYRFLQFAQDLIIYTIDNGSNIFQKYQLLIKQNKNAQQPEKVSLNKQFKTYTEEQANKIIQMQKQYQTLFINPIQIKNESIIYLLIVFARAEEHSIKNKQQQTSFYDKSSDIYIDPRVMKWLFIQLVKPEMSYTVRQLLLLLKYPSFFENHSKLNIKDLIINKLQNLRDKTASYTQLKQLMNTLQIMEFNQLKPVLNNFLKRNHPSDIYKMAKLIQQQKWTPYLIDFMLRLPEVVNIHEKYYSFEENCYFLYIFLQGNQYWGWDIYKGDTNLRINYDSQVQKLKQQIKIVTYTRGFKLTVDSYFHKILQKIDAVDFFEGGRA